MFIRTQLVIAFGAGAIGLLNLSLAQAASGYGADHRITGVPLHIAKRQNQMADPAAPVATSLSGLPMRVSTTRLGGINQGTPHHVASAQPPRLTGIAMVQAKRL